MAETPPVRRVAVALFEGFTVLMSMDPYRPLLPAVFLGKMALFSVCLRFLVWLSKAA